jgi:O-antigen/teichoic acid export membrane protein
MEYIILASLCISPFAGAIYNIFFPEKDAEWYP